MSEEQPQVLKDEIGFKAVELIFGNPVVLGIFGLVLLGFTGVVFLSIWPESTSKDILIPAMTGVGALASGVAIGKLSK